MSSLRIQKCLCTEFQLKCKIRKLLFKDNLSAQLAHHLIFGLVLLVFDFQWGGGVGLDTKQFKLGLELRFIIRFDRKGKC